VLARSELLHDLRVDVVLGLPVGGLVKVTALLLVSVLLRGPNLGVLLGGHFKRSGVKSLKSEVGFTGGLLCDFILGVVGELVVEVVGGHVVGGAVVVLVVGYTRDKVNT